MAWSDNKDLRGRSLSLPEGVGGPAKQLVLLKTAEGPWRIGATLKPWHTHRSRHEHIWFTTYRFQDIALSWRNFQSQDAFRLDWETDLQRIQTVFGSEGGVWFTVQQREPTEALFPEWEPQTDSWQVRFRSLEER